MPTLKELLDELEIAVEDDKPDEEDKFDVSTLDEKAKAHMDGILGEKSNLENEVASQKLVIQTMKESMKTIEPKTEEKKKDDLGLDEDDQYAPIFNKMFGAIDEIKKATTVDEGAEFKKNIIEFAKDNKDIAKYANEMDSIANQHPTLRNDIPTLYSLGKKAVERRDELKKRKKTETGGTSTSKVIDIQQSKTIAEAFDIAQTQMNRR